MAISEAIRSASAAFEGLRLMRPVSAAITATLEALTDTRSAAVSRYLVRRIRGTAGLSRPFADGYELVALYISVAGSAANRVGAPTAADIVGGVGAYFLRRREAKLECSKSKVVLGSPVM